MKKKSIISILIICVFLGSLSISCKSTVDKEESTEIDSQAISDSLLTSDDDLVFYSFPSSQEMFSFIKKDVELVYRTDLVNSTDNISKYIDTKSKNLVLGVYLADLSYMTLFNKTSSAYEYIDVITRLSNDLRINLPFQDQFLERIKNNLSNEDSLAEISDQYSNKIVDYLLQNNKDKILANITAASYIEGLYLALNLVGEYSDDNLVIKRIVEQKHSFTNLIKYAKKYYYDENTNTAINLLTQIYNVFEKFQVIEETKTTVERDANNRMVLKGGKKIVISENEYNELKQIVSDVRNKIIENNL
jgi:hypothetical protein